MATKTPARTTKPGTLTELAALLPAKDEKALSQKLRKASDALATLRKAASGVDPASLFWNLMGRGVLALEDIAANEALEEMAESVPEEAPLLAFVARLHAFTAPGLGDVLPRVSEFLLTAIVASYGNAPAAWEKAFASLPPRIQDLVNVARARHGARERVPEADRGRLLDELAAHMFEEEALWSSRDALEALGDADEIGRRLAPLLLERAPSKPSFFEAGLLLVPWERLMQLDDRGSLVDVASLRGDVTAEQATAWAERLRKDGADDAACAVLRIARSRKREIVPGPEWDAVFERRLVEHDVEGLLPLLPGIPQNRVLSIHRRAREACAEPHHRAWAYPLLRFTNDDAALEAAIAETRKLASARALAQFQPEFLGGGTRLAALPLLEEAYRTAGPDLRPVFRRALIAQAAVTGAAGETLPARCDVYLAADDENIALASHHFGYDPSPWSAALVPAIASLPEARGRLLVQGWLAADGDGTLHMRESFEKMLPTDRKPWLDAAEPVLGRLRRLVRETGRAATRRVYVLRPLGEATATSSWAGSTVLGLPPEALPRHEGRPMEHVLTLDLELMPELRERAGCGDARALAVFISSRRRHRAFSPETSETEIVPLTAAQAAKGHANEGRSYAVDAIDVPPEVFFGDAHRSDRALQALRRAFLDLPGWALGGPIFIQDAEGTGDEFLAQVSAALVPELNTGDNGMLYVMSSGAFVQCA